MAIIKKRFLNGSDASTNKMKHDYINFSVCEEKLKNEYQKKQRDYYFTY